MPSSSWFYVDRGQQRGPVATEELAGWIQSARLPRDVQVWREGLPQWTAAETLPELASQLQAVGFFLMGANGPQGPVDAQVVREWARAGHIGRETLVWRHGLPEWITAGAVPEIAPYLPAAGAVYAPPAAPTMPAAASAPIPTVREARPVPDRDGPCPLCGDTTKMGPRARVLYEYWICRKCNSGMVNRRQFAWLLDVAVLYLVLFMVAFVVGAAGSVAKADISAVIAVLPWLLYAAWLFKDGFNGHSLGKAAMGLQVVDVDTGQGAGFGASLKRNLPLLIPFAPLVAAFQMSRGPRLGDGWANTRVVWKKHQGRGPF
jgi:uncharacterized RDD family membrane protein YckC